MVFSVGSWRRAKGITQKDMSERLGVHINTYQNWEKSPQNISMENAQKIARIFGVSIEDISFKEEKA